MSTKIDPITRKPISVERVGVVPSVIYFATDTAEKTSSALIGAGQDVRVELRQVTESSIEIAENLVKALFKITRRVAARLDELSESTLVASERTFAGVLRAVRETTHAAAELTTTAVAGVAADEPSRPVVTATAQA